MRRDEPPQGPVTSQVSVFPSRVGALKNAGRSGSTAGVFWTGAIRKPHGDGLRRRQKSHVREQRVPVALTDRGIEAFGRAHRPLDYLGQRHGHEEIRDAFGELERRARDRGDGFAPRYAADLCKERVSRLLRPFDTDGRTARRERQN